MLVKIIFFADNAALSALYITLLLYICNYQLHFLQEYFPQKYFWGHSFLNGMISSAIASSLCLSVCNFNYSNALSVMQVYFGEKTIIAKAQAR